jgi:His-Xaa-Ser system protein HxsD
VAARTEVVISFDLTLYPLAAVRAAAYRFLERAHVLLTPDGEQRVAVRLRPRPGAGRAADLAGEFENEALNQRQRAVTARRNARLRELIVGRALIGAQVGEDPLAGEDDDYLDDPLGIAVPWEERYGAPAAGEAAPAPAEPSPATDPAAGPAPQAGAGADPEEPTR